MVIFRHSILGGVPVFFASVAEGNLAAMGEIDQVGGRSKEV